MVKFLSLNVRGLREDPKRKEMFTFLQNKAFDIILFKRVTSLLKLRKRGKTNGEGLFSIVIIILVQEVYDPFQKRHRNITSLNR